ncbi:hypothetical protein RJC90_17725, partial [Acinetobacter baumannii]|uniref:hypothetical protein n=1 Tax=Acinetobacter baumannii TaxID=470 RepID=UPI002870A707
QVVHSCYGRQHNCLWILALVLFDAEVFSKSVTDWADSILLYLFILARGITKSSCLAYSRID